MNYIVLPLLLFILSSSLYADEIGSVDTVFKFFGSNHKIIVEAFDDPKVPGVTCHLSRAKTGGISGSLGLPKTKQRHLLHADKLVLLNSLLTFKTGNLSLVKKRLLLFKTIQVVRFYDKKRNVLIYLVYSDKLIEESPKNSISTVPILKWKQ